MKIVFSVGACYCGLILQKSGEDEMKIIDEGYGRWIFYVEGEPSFDESTGGKWMCYPHDLGIEDELSFSRKICSEAVAQGIVQEAKCRHISENGVCCFYLDCDDIDSHKRVIQYFMDNNLIQKTDTGRFHNISFKLNSQTYSGQYGNGFKSEIKLSKFLNLKTGEWLV